MELKLTLPWPPSVNHYKKIGRIVTTKTGKLYQQRINSNETASFYYKTYIQAKQIMPKEWLKYALDDTISFALSVYLYAPNKSRYDIDNRLKVLIDGIVKAHVINDDSQITRLYVEKMENFEKGQVIVNIQALGV